jgi:hypothetical protein
MSLPPTPRPGVVITTGKLGLKEAPTEPTTLGGWVGPHTFILGFLTSSNIQYSPWTFSNIQYFSGAVSQYFNILSHFYKSHDRLVQFKTQSN